MRIQLFPIKLDIKKIWANVTLFTDFFFVLENSFFSQHATYANIIDF